MVRGPEDPAELTVAVLTMAALGTWRPLKKAQRKQASKEYAMRSSCLESVGQVGPLG